MTAISASCDRLMFVSKLWLANCYFAHNSLEFPVLLGFCDARSGRPFHPFHRYPGSLAQTWGARSIVAESLLLKHQFLILHHRTHHSREGRTPDMPVSPPVANLRSFRWQPHCRGLYRTPMAA